MHAPSQLQGCLHVIFRRITVAHHVASRLSRACTEALTACAPLNCINTLTLKGEHGAREGGSGSMFMGVRDDGVMDCLEIVFAGGGPASGSLI